MIDSEFQDKRLGLLGFGTMRLPTHADGSIDEAQVAEMTAYALEHGVNYFDTAYPYHGGESERVIGRVLSKYPRDSWYLATKYPGHQISSTGYNPAEIFEEQLQKCGVEYFDFYLLHNVYEKSMEVYLDPQWGIVDYFKEQKRLGRIKHLGFSCHAETKGLKEFLDVCGEDMEFCQIQLNWLDWTLQDAKGKYDLLTRRGIPVWVMEPVRGGRLASLSDAEEAKLKALRPEDSVASWGFRFLQALPNVKMVLSGMSSMEQVLDNIATMQDFRPLSQEESALIEQLRTLYQAQNRIPCTACRYCTDGCPASIDIPGLFACLNDKRQGNEGADDAYAAFENKADACLECGQCEKECPQHLRIRELLKEVNAAF